MTTQPAPAEIKHLLRAWESPAALPPAGPPGLLFAGLVVDGCVQLHGDKGELVLRFTRLAG